MPEEKIESRIPRTVHNVLNAMPLCDDVWILDNSSVSNPFKKVLRIQNNQTTSFADPLPAWANAFMTH